MKIKFCLQRYLEVAINDWPSKKIFPTEICIHTYVGIREMQVVVWSCRIFNIASVIMHGVTLVPLLHASVIVHS